MVWMPVYSFLLPAVPFSLYKLLVYCAALALCKPIFEQLKCLHFWQKTTRHDVIAFLSCVGEYIGDDAKYMHAGMTSSDVLDTSEAVQMKQAGEAILEQMKLFTEINHKTQLPSSHI